MKIAKKIQMRHFECLEITQKVSLFDKNCKKLFSNTVYGYGLSRCYFAHRLFWFKKGRALHSTPRASSVKLDHFRRLIRATMLNIWDLKKSGLCAKIEKNRELSGFVLLHTGARRDRSRCCWLDTTTLEYLITVQHLITANIGKLDFIWLAKEGQFDVVKLMVNDHFKTFSINLNARYVNGMTPFDSALSTVIGYSRVGGHNLELRRLPPLSAALATLVLALLQQLGKLHGPK